MSNLGPPLTLCGILIVGAAICWLGDVIRRRTGGRIRHAEIHFIAWIPTLLLEGALAWMSFDSPRVPGSSSSAMVYLFPLVFAGIVYLLWFLEILGHRSSWKQSEEQLDEGDERWLEEKRRRDRIDSYKHKGGPRTDTRR
jgi:hypothetical protein